MKKDDSVYIEHIMNGLNKIEKYTGDMDQKHFFCFRPSAGCCHKTITSHWRGNKKD